MPMSEINYLAILVSALVYMVLGYLWYGPLFGKPWMKLVGMTAKDAEEAKNGMGKTYGLSFLGALIKSYVLALFIYGLGAGVASTGMTIGFLVWLGFVAPTAANDFLFSVKPRPWSLYFLNQGYLLITLLISGAILAVWK